jgi:DNA-binding response OmpR family regulator
MELLPYADRRVLIVDDDRDFLDSCILFLEGAGLKNIGQARNGASAVRLAREIPPDLVLLDINMPGMSGWDVIENFRRFAISTKIIMSSADNHAEAIVKAIKLGATDYIVKETFSSEVEVKIIEAFDFGANLGEDPKFAVLKNALYRLRDKLLKVDGVDRKKRLEKDEAVTLIDGTIFQITSSSPNLKVLRSDNLKLKRIFKSLSMDPSTEALWQGTTELLNLIVEQ